MVTLENRFSWLFLQAFYCQNEKQKHNFFFFNENYGNKGLNVFVLCKNLSVRSYLKIIGLARFDPGGPGPLNQNATNGKNLTEKPCFFIFSFFLGSLHTTVHAYNST